MSKQINSELFTSIWLKYPFKGEHKCFFNFQRSTHYSFLIHTQEHDS
jgi:hypothetical protein